MPEHREPAPIGKTLDALGITATIGPGDLVVGAVVLLKVVTEAGRERLSVSESEGISWLEKAGMLHTADELHTARWVNRQADGA